MIRYGKQYIDKKDQKAVLSILKSDWLTQGPQIEIFENSLKRNFGAKYCCAVSNGTAALHLTGLALGWKKGDIILCSSISFLSASNSVIYSGATPDFVDISLHDYNINIIKLKEKVNYYHKKNKKIKAIIATDFAGNPCDWNELKKISVKHNIKLINDNCHALGSVYKNDRKYSVKYADVVTQSFHPVKNITTGEGGAVLTNNKTIYEKIKILRSHGIIRNAKKVKKTPWYYEMQYLGYNYRISDFQCALGNSQLKKISKFLKKRNKIAKAYNAYLSNHDLIETPKVKKNNKHSFHLYPLLINFKKSKISKKKLFNELKKRGVIPQVHYIPIHLQPYYRKKFGFKKGDFPLAEKFYEQEVSLPIFYTLKFEKVKYISNLIKKII